MDYRDIHDRIVACNRCPRLRKHCLQTAAVKKREFRDWSYWGKPVPGFGDPSAALWIVGLAPAAHGANRTGRMFTGDSSGNWLYAALFKYGFANQPTSFSSEDGLELKDVFISAAARCAPPDNKPLPSELAECARFLDEEWAMLKRARIYLALGSIAFETTLKLLQRQGQLAPSERKGLRFGHLVEHRIGNKVVLSSYHPSRQNTQTGRLTLDMWNQVFERARELVS